MWLDLLYLYSCPVKPVRLLSSPVSQDVKFSFKAFDFRHNSSGFVYIHCEVTVCRTSDSNCMMGCGTRTRRAASVNPFGGSHLLSTGPFILPREEAKEGKWSLLLELCFIKDYMYLCLTLIATELNFFICIGLVQCFNELCLLLIKWNQMQQIFCLQNISVYEHVDKFIWLEWQQFEGVGMF